MSIEDRHKQKMAHRKAVQDAEVASKLIREKGLLIVHTATLGTGGLSGFRFAFTALPPRLSCLMGLPQTEGGGDGAAGGQ